MSCRVGLPVENLAHGYRQSVSSPIFSTAIGLLQRGLEDVEYRDPALEPAANETIAETALPNNSNSTSPESNAKEPSNVSEEKSPTWLENVFKKTKEWFEAEPDMDFKK
jgi:cell division protein FtsA